MPVVVLADPANNLQLEIVSGTFGLDGIGAYSSVMSLKTTDHGVVTTSSFSCSGTYLVSANSLVFTRIQGGQYCGGSFSATWDGSDALAFVFSNGDPAVFVR